MKLIQIIAILIVLAFPSILVAQDTTAYQLQLVGRAQKDQIILRWAPNSPYLWELANKHGMILERYTILRDGKALKVPERQTYPLFKPLPLEEWEAIGENDDYALVAAQAIYGDSLEVTEDFSSDISKAINQTTELEQRHLFALFAADQSKKAALASGLMLEDTTVKENEKYLYTITCQFPAPNPPVDTVSIYIGLDDYFELPAPTGLSGEIVKENIVLSWEARRYKDFYNSYWVERSDDGGKTFVSITENPIVSPLNVDGQVPEYMFKGDSIGELQKRYIYRVKGINPFGEVSPASDTIGLIAYPGLSATPHISKVIPLPEGGMQISWSFPAAQRDSILGFRLKRSDHINNEYKTIQDQLSPRDSLTIDLHPLPSNYYTITAFDEFGNESTSLPFLGMPEDSIPPGPPTGLQGSIDTNGIVTLRWTPNTEADVIGYQVFQANFKNEEFVQVTSKTVKDTTYADTITLKTLTHAVYYKLKALDSHFNPSDFSVAIQLKRPDTIAPAPPQFHTVKSEDKGISLAWTPSISDDVASHVLYRKSLNQDGWKNLREFKQDTAFFLDKSVVANTQYAYLLIAIDSTGNESKLSETVSISSKGNNIAIAISSLKAKKDYEEKSIILSWENTNKDVHSYRIYRAKGEEPLTLYKVVQNKAPLFNDGDVKKNTKYHYRVQVALENGVLSEFSKEIKVNY